MNTASVYRRLLIGLLLCSSGTVAFSRSETCRPTGKQEILSLFDQWNAALETGHPQTVVALYAPSSILLPTVSNQPRITAAQKLDYFEKFLLNKPRGHIDMSWVEIDCNTAINSGLYTFTYADGTQVKARYTYTYKRARGHWLISSHHSSAAPE